MKLPVEKIDLDSLHGLNIFSEEEDVINGLVSLVPEVLYGVQVAGWLLFHPALPETVEALLAPGDQIKVQGQHDGHHPAGHNQHRPQQLQDVQPRGAHGHGFMRAGHEAEGKHDTQQRRSWQYLAGGEGNLEGDIAYQVPQPQMGLHQAVDFLKKIDNDKEGDEGGQAQNQEFEKLPCYVSFQDARPQSRVACFHEDDISE